MLCILDIMVVGIYVKFYLEFKCNAWKRFIVKDYLKKNFKGHEKFTLVFTAAGNVTGGTGWQ